MLFIKRISSATEAEAALFWKETLYYVKPCQIPNTIFCKWVIPYNELTIEAFTVQMHPICWSNPTSTNNVALETLKHILNGKHILAIECSGKLLTCSMWHRNKQWSCQGQRKREASDCMARKRDLYREHNVPQPHYQTGVTTFWYSCPTSRGCHHHKLHQVMIAGTD
jgi:hypothetical protein